MVSHGGSGLGVVVVLVELSVMGTTNSYLETQHHLILFLVGDILHFAFYIQKIKF